MTSKTKDLKRPIKQRIAPGELTQALPENMHPVIRRVYAARGLAADATDLSLQNLLPISLLEHTATAAERLTRAYANKEKVLVVGDYDADGATATALVIECLREFGFTSTDYLIPDRQKFGYGLTTGIVALAAQKQPDVIVTVDNGISSHAGIEMAQARNIDVIVTDHHLPGESLPAAEVIVNPNAPDSHFPSKHLAGVGVAFYVMAALGQRLAGDGVLSQESARNICTACLDLVALGSVADLVQLDRNNRILVSQGLQRIRRRATRPGIIALFDVAGRNIEHAVAADLGFAVGPRINAAGRLDDMTIGVECLLATSTAKATTLANELDRLNRERRDLQTTMQASAELHLDQQLIVSQAAADSAVCLFDPSWHPGVVGLVATRIKDAVNRPVIAFAAETNNADALLKGSGRSVAGVHMRDVLATIDSQHPGLITKFGGHAMAAGLSLAAESLDEFRAVFVAEVERHIDVIDDSGTLLTDGELDAADLSLDFAELLRESGPWGQGFPEPLFEGRFAVLDQHIVGNSHLKLKVRQVDSQIPIEAIAFNRDKLLREQTDETFLFVFRLDVNEFRQTRRHQLVVEHLESV